MTFEVPVTALGGFAADEPVTQAVQEVGSPATPDRAGRPEHFVLSVVMPAYNEAGNIDAALDDVAEHVLARVSDAEVIVVDDGSRDGTADAVRRRAAIDHRIRLVGRPNGGHGPALVHGIRTACGEYCLLLDSDRQIGLERFAETWPLRTGHDAVFGVRRQREDPRHRLALSRALRAGLRLTCGVAAADANAPYKLVRRTVLLEALATMPDRPRIPSVLLTVHLHRRGASIVEQVIPHRRRGAGESSLRLGRLVRFCAQAAGELARFRIGL